MTDEKMRDLCDCEEFWCAEGDTMCKRCREGKSPEAYLLNIVAKTLEERFEENAEYERAKGDTPMLRELKRK